MAMPRPVALVLGLLLLSGPALAGDPSTDQLVFTGATAPGTNTLSFSGNVYTFTFAGDETIAWQIDLSDPKVAGGMLRVRELSSDSYPIDGGGPAFRDAAGVFTYPNTNYKKTTLSGHSMSGGVLTLNYVLNLNGTHPYRYEIRAQGKQLRIRCWDTTANKTLANNFSGLAFMKSTGVENPVAIKMQGTLAQPITMFRRVTSSATQHWFMANAFDQFQSNGTDYRIGPLISPQVTADTTTASLDTATRYDPMTNGVLAAGLDDAFVLVVSSKVRDVLLDSTAPASPYRSLLANRMFIDGTASQWNNYVGMFDKFAECGLYNLATYFFFQWTTSAKDLPGPSSMGPDWAPAIDQPNFQALLHDGTAFGTLIGAYTTFNCLPGTAPPSVSDPTQIVVDSSGAPKTYTGMGFPLLSVEAAGLHAKSETAKLKTLGANLVYLDIQTYGSIAKGPDGGHLDQKATSPWSKTSRQGYTAQKGWFEDMRNTLVGPLLGEGSIGQANANMEFLYHGYVDSVQRVINTGNGKACDLPAGSPSAPTNWPIIPEYEWRVAAKRSVNHGNGFHDRFFGPSDGPTIVKGDGKPIFPLTQDALDLYQAFLISYGHAGYIITNGTDTALDTMSYAQAAQTYFLSNALQNLYFTSPITTIRYAQQGQWKTFEEIISVSETLDSFRHVPVRLDFANGLRITVNHGSGPITLLDGTQTFTLPAKTGWFASMGSSFRAFSAIPPTTGGKRIDYCKAPGQYEYFNGRGQVSAYGSISTTAKRSKWTVTPTNITVTEDTAGKLHSVAGLPPLLLNVALTPGASLTLPIGDRVGLKATANFSNGGLFDFTTLLGWVSTKPGIVSVNAAGVVTAKAKGTAKIYAMGIGGAVISAPVTITVP